VSVAEIIAELPKLKEEERVAIARRLHELEDADALQFLDEAFIQACQEMDKLEAQDRRSGVGFCH